MSEQKYVVFKKDDFIRLTTDNMWSDTRDGLIEGQLNDAFVLRLQDQLATSALYAYASSVQTAIEILTAEASSTEYIQETIHKLCNIRDTAFEWAERGRATHKKLPD